MDGRTPTPEILASLDRVMQAFIAIKTYMNGHLARNRLIRAISYTFNASQHIERLTRGLSEAVQELTLVTALDTNHRVNEGQRYTGQFALIREYEVDNLGFIREDRDKEEDGELVIRYHAARINGQLLVLRDTGGRGHQAARAGGTAREGSNNRVNSHDRVLEAVSSIRTSHRNVARIYGYVKSSESIRMVAIKSGFHPLKSIAYQTSSPATTFCRCALKLLDAARHLRTIGLSWSPQPFCFIMIDDNLEPTIGLDNDLSLRCDSSSNTVPEITAQLHAIFWRFWCDYPAKVVSSTDARKAFADWNHEGLDRLLHTLKEVERQRFEVVKAAISSRQLFSGDTTEALLRVQEAPADDPSAYPLWPWSQLMLMLDPRRSHRSVASLQVVYNAWPGLWDSITIQGVAEDNERVVFDRYTINIPAARRGELSELLGVPPPSAAHRFEYHFVPSLGEYRIV